MHTLESMTVYGIPLQAAKVHTNRKIREYGTYTHLSPTPFMTGAPKLVKLLTEDVEGLTGGKIALGDDPIQVSEGIEVRILSKRKALGLK